MTTLERLFERAGALLAELEDDDDVEEGTLLGPPTGELCVTEAALTKGDVSPNPDALPPLIPNRDLDNAVDFPFLSLSSFFDVDDAICEADIASDATTSAMKVGTSMLLSSEASCASRSRLNGFGGVFKAKAVSDFTTASLSVA